MRIGKTTLEVIRGETTKQNVEAIVNATNTGLTGIGRVDGAIHRAGGPQISEECRQLGSCRIGQAKLTSGGNLRARYIIHAVGPDYTNGYSAESLLLTWAYQGCLELVAKHQIKSIAFPSLSTRASRYPIRLAAGIAFRTVLQFLRTEKHELELVRFVLFDGSSFGFYEKEMKNQLIVNAYHRKYNSKQ